MSGINVLTIPHVTNTEAEWETFYCPLLNHARLAYGLRITVIGNRKLQIEGLTSNREEMWSVIVQVPKEDAP